MLREARFKLEPIQETVFDGYTEGETWNGWERPYFTFEQAQRILEAHLKRDVRAWYDEDLDQFVFDLNQHGEEALEVFPSVALERKRLYPIGNGRWIWETV